MEGKKNTGRGRRAWAATLNAISAASVSTRGLSGFTLNSRVKMVTPARSDLNRPGPTRGPGGVWVSGPHDRPVEHWAGPAPLSPLSTQRKEGRREGGREEKREGANPFQPRGHKKDRARKGKGKDPHPGQLRPPTPGLLRRPGRGGHRARWRPSPRPPARSGSTGTPPAS